MTYSPDGTKLVNIKSNMKVLLTAINSKYIHSNPAVYYLRAYANDRLKDDGIGKSRIEVGIAEYTINQNADEILAGIYNERPDVMALSCYIWNREMVERILVDINKVLPDCHIVLGGPEASYDAESLLEKYDFLDAVMMGEGEETFYELCCFYLDMAEGIIPDMAEDRLLDIDGLCVMKESEDGNGECKKQPVYTKMRRLLSMDEIPFFYREWQDDEKLGPFANKIIYYETSRGCPFSCSYCLSSIDKTVRIRSIEKVKPELDFFLEKKVPQVKFVDRTFNCNARHASDIWRYIRDNDNGITNFHFEVSADILTKEELDIMRDMRPGLIQLEIGVQTTNPETMKAIRRTASLEKIRENTARVRSFGNIHQHLDLIAGLPFENLESFKKSFNDVYSMNPDQLQLGFLKVLRGSNIAETAGEYGIKSHSGPPFEVISTRWITYDEIRLLKKVEEVVEIYYNSGQFTRTMPYLAAEFASPFECFEALADYFDRRGYFINHPARAYRYDVLLAFANEICPEKDDLFRELLTCDLYLRENMKSRPAFARNLKEYKKEIIARSDSKKDHIEVFYYPVFEEGLRPMEKSPEPYYVLFDYENRGALDNNAALRLANVKEA